MGVLPDVRGLNATDLFENTKILIELEKRAPQFKRSEGDPSPRHHINWSRTSFAVEYANPKILIHTALRRASDQEQSGSALMPEW
jgi:hypothetical protein